MNPNRRRLKAWIASFAILLSVLAPSLAQALATADGRTSTWSEICTATGKSIQVAGVLPESDELPAHRAGHCPWCSGMSHTPALPVSQYPMPTANEANATPVRYVDRVPDFDRYSGASRPRAPPANS
jgi:hypothetical protein